MTVPDVLAEANVPEGRRGLTRCPLHDDRTPSFSYTERGWHCFGCGQSGNAWALAVKLGLRRERFRAGEPIVRGLSRHVLARPGPDPAPRPLSPVTRLLRAILRQERAVLKGSELLLEDVEDRLSMADDLWRSGRHRIDVRDAAADLVWEALALEERVRPRHGARRDFIGFVMDVRRQLQGERV